MKRIFNAWFRENYPDCKSEWAWRVHDAFIKHVNSDRNSIASCSIREVSKWLRQLGVVVIDRKGRNGKKIRNPKHEVS